MVHCQVRSLSGRNPGKDLRWWWDLHSRPGWRSGVAGDGRGSQGPRSRGRVGEGSRSGTWSQWRAPTSRGVASSSTRGCLSANYASRPLGASLPILLVPHPRTRGCFGPTLQRVRTRTGCKLEQGQKLGHESGRAARTYRGLRVWVGSRLPSEPCSDGTCQHFRHTTCSRETNDSISGSGSPSLKENIKSVSTMDESVVSTGLLHGKE